MNTHQEAIEAIREALVILESERPAPPVEPGLDYHRYAIELEHTLLSTGFDREALRRIRSAHTRGEGAKCKK